MKERWKEGRKEGGRGGAYIVQGDSLGVGVDLMPPTFRDEEDV